MSDSLLPHGLQSPWNPPGQNSGVGSLSLLQMMFPTQGSNPGLPPCRWILYQLSHQGSPSEFQREVQILADQGRERIQETREAQSRNNSAALRQGPGVASRDHVTMSLKSSADVNY